MLTPASLFAQGLHCIKLWRNRSETRVIVDDRLPVDSHGRLIFGSSRSGSEFWVPIFEKAYGADHTSVAATLNNMAVVRHDLGQNEEARALYRRCEAIYSAAYGADHSETVDARRKAEACT